MATKKKTETEKTNKVLTATVVGDLPLNVRSGKTTDDPNIVRQIQPGTKVEVLKEGKQWCQVGTDEYVMRQFLAF